MEGRGSSDKCVTEAGKIAAVKWYGNCADVVKRWSKKDVTFVKVSRPEIVKFYNKSIGESGQECLINVIVPNGYKEQKMNPLHHLSLFQYGYNKFLVMVQMRCKLFWNSSEKLNRFIRLLFQIEEVLSFSNQLAAPTKPGCPSGNIPAVPPPKKKLNLSELAMT
ncbi:hypothetical protein AVEN_192574-1 [Araneus ventricosus]|nr:hypothetical protein AVEN_184648-1 [Araneus ventricosus]GBN73204.1 hypothetical protein AVEN_192574-1 [Araneus ventricosus]